MKFTGRLGSAILRGLLKVLSKDLLTINSLPKTLPKKFLACVRTGKSAKLLEDQSMEYLMQLRAINDDNGEIASGLHNSADEPIVKVLRGQNVPAVARSSTVLLACQPPQIPAVLAEAGMVDALRGKLILNICAGISESAIREHIVRGLRSTPHGRRESEAATSADQYYIVHAMPNAASVVGESATILSSRKSTFPADYETITNWVFNSIGSLTEVPSELMNAASITAGSTPGFLALALQSITAGAVAAGLDEKVALRMAAQAMKGMAELVLAGGEKPQGIIDKVATPGGCTEQGLLSLRASESKSSVATAYELAVKAAIAKAFELGAGSNESKTLSSHH